jgi:Tfp pilus assembly protein PilO
MSKLKSASSRTPPSWLVTGFVATLAVLYTLFIFMPGQRKAAALKLKKLELMQYVTNQAKTTLKIQQAQERNAQALQTTVAWHEQAPKVSDLGRTLSSITLDARQAGVTLQKFDPLPQVKLNSLVQQPIAVALEGDFAQIFDFLARLESRPHRIWISNLTLSQPAEDGKTLRAEMTLTIFADLAENAERAKSA